MSSSTSQRPNGNTSPAPPTFSYAQAAKGLVPGPARTPPARQQQADPKSQPDAQPSSQTAAPVPTSTTDKGVGETVSHATGSPKPQGTPAFPASGGASSQQSVSERDTSHTSVAASSDTSVSHASLTAAETKPARAEGTISDVQAGTDPGSSTSTAKPAGGAGDETKSGNGAEKPIDPPKTLQDAPPPKVNVWKQRAQEAQAKATSQTQKTSIPAQATVSRSSGPSAKPSPRPVVSNNVAEVQRGSRPGPAIASDEQIPGTARPRKTGEGPLKGRLPERTEMPKKDHKPEIPFDHGKPKEVRPTRASSMSTVANDEYWPTPENATDEERKRTQAKPEKQDKDKASGTGRPHGKNEWVPVQINPSVVFQTQLPPGPKPGRGRGGGRGGRENSTRGAYAPHTSAPGDRHRSTITTNGDASRGARTGGTSPSEGPGSRYKRSSSVGSNARRGGAATSASGTRTQPSSAITPSEAHPPRRSGLDSPSANQSNAFPRQTQGKGSKPKKAEESSFSDRRREGELASDKPRSLSPGKSRQNGPAVNGDESTDRRAFGNGDNYSAHGKPAHHDKRHVPHLSMSSRDGNSGRGRGGSRGGRGSHTFAGPPHHTHQPFQGHGLPPLQTPNSFSGLPRSPQPFVPEQQAQYYFSNPQSSNRYRGSGSRMPGSGGESGYAHANGPFSAVQPTLPPLHSMMPSPYDYQAFHPMSAQPFSPYTENMQLVNMLTSQLEYYFSIDNLCKDMFLRKHMDSQGFVLLGFVADFNRVKKLSTDLELIKLVCFQSPSIDYKIGNDGLSRLRKTDGWAPWVLAKEEREAVARNDGPQTLHNPPMPHPPGFEVQYMYRPQQPMMPTSMPQSPSLANNDGSFAHLNGFATPHAPSHQPPVNSSHHYPDASSPAFIPSASFSHQHQLHQQQQQHHPTSAPAATRPNQTDEDDFSDQQVEKLKIVSREAQNPSANTKVDRTTSPSTNGATTVAHSSDASDKPATAQGAGKVNGHPNSHEDANKGQGLKNFEVVPSRDSPTPTGSMPPPKSNNEPYIPFRASAMEQRQLARDGQCPHEMEILYQFWSHFLVGNFNGKMYAEFRSVAVDDESRRHVETGMMALRDYYGSVLRSPHLIKYVVARDILERVNMEAPTSERPLFKQLRSAWRNGAMNLKTRKRLQDLMDSGLKTELEL